MQGAVLSRDISVDSGIILKATRVDSHLIFLNSRGTTRIDDTQAWGFSVDILGVMSNQNGSLMGASNDLLAAFANYFTRAGNGPLPFNAGV
jgi:hypothetical protein